MTNEESVLATYMYAIRNKLSYQATSQLLELMKIHQPSPNSFPRSFYKLKKHLSGVASLELRRFCSSCLDEILEGRKQCGKRQCKQSTPSYYAVLPFQEHLECIFEGKYNLADIVKHTIVTICIYFQTSGNSFTIHSREKSSMGKFLTYTMVELIKSSLSQEAFSLSQSTLG